MKGLFSVFQKLTKLFLFQTNFTRNHFLGDRTRSLGFSASYQVPPGTASTSLVLPFYDFLQCTCASYAAGSRRAGPPPAYPSFVVFLVLVLGSLFFLSAFVFSICCTGYSGRIPALFLVPLFSLGASFYYCCCTGLSGFSPVFAVLRPRTFCPRSIGFVFVSSCGSPFCGVVADFPGFWNCVDFCVSLPPR